MAWSSTFWPALSSTRKQYSGRLINSAELRRDLWPAPDRALAQVRIARTDAFNNYHRRRCRSQTRLPLMPVPHTHLHAYMHVQAGHKGLGALTDHIIYADGVSNEHSDVPAPSELEGHLRCTFQWLSEVTDVQNPDFSASWNNTELC